MAQELHDQRSIDMLQMQLRRRHLQATAGVFEEELEGVCIRVAGIAAGAPLDGQALLEECRDVRCDQGHGLPPSLKFSQTSAMFLIRSGVASRYQVCAAAHTW